MEGASQPASERSPRAGLVIALGILGLALAGVTAALVPPPARDVDAPAGDFASGRALARLAEVLGDQRPHPIGSAAGAAVQGRLADALRGAGLDPEIQEVTGCGRRSASCGRVGNVLARIPGRGAPDHKAILISAHHDSVAAGPGAGDDGSGVAVILELARIFAARGPGSTRHDLIFLLVDGEEYGLLGAEAFIAAHPWADDVVFALNLDSGGNDGLATLTRTSADNGPAIAALSVALRRPSAASLTATAYALTPYDTDFSAYDRAGIFALDLGIGEDKAPYHTPIDRLEAVDQRSIQHLGESALAAIAALDSLDRAAIEGAGDRVYLDLGGRALWSAPAAAIPWIALVLLGALLALVARLRRHEATGARWLWGLAAWPIIVLGALAPGAAAAWLMAVIAGAEAASYAAPLTPRIALWTLVLAVGGAIAGRLESRTSPLALWAGAWIILGALELIVAIVAPGAVVVLLPALAAQVALAAIGLALTRGRRLPSAALYLGLLVPAYLWLQAALRVEDIFGLGRHGGALALAPLALLAGLLAPIWAATPVRQRRWVLALAAALIAGAGLVAALSPAHSPSRPRRLSYTLHRDADAGESRWLVQERAGGLPASVRAAAEFADDAAPSFPWSGEDDESYVAGAADLDLTPPELTTLSDEAGPWGRLLRLRLRSPRGARRAALLIPDEAGVRAIAIDGATLGPYPERRREDYPDARCHGVIGVPPEGVEIALILASPGPTEFTLWDLSDGLPDAPESAALRAARPADHVASHGGDVTMVSRRVER